MRSKVIFFVLLIILVAFVLFAPQAGPFRDWVVFERVQAIAPHGAYLEVYKIKRWGRHAGKKHGHYVSFYQGSSFKFAEGYLENDVPTGIWTWWDEQHKSVKFQERYENGRPVERRIKAPWWDVAIDPEASESPEALER